MKQDWCHWYERAIDTKWLETRKRVNFAPGILRGYLFRPLRLDPPPLPPLHSLRAMDPDADMLDLTAPSSTSPPPPSSDIVDSPIIPSTTSTAEIPKQNALKNSNKPKPVSTAKPRTSKPARSPSPSPPPQPVRPPLQTIRLVIKLGGPDNYEVNLAELAKSTGQRAPTPVPVKRDTSESEGEGDDDEAKDQPKEKKKRVRISYLSTVPYLTFNRRRT